jgi:hypothetical protein
MGISTFDPILRRSHVGASLIASAPHNVANRQRHFIGFGVEREVTGVEHVKLSLGASSSNTVPRRG